TPLYFFRFRVEDSAGVVLYLPLFLSLLHSILPRHALPLFAFDTCDRRREAGRAHHQLCPLPLLHPPLPFVVQFLAFYFLIRVRDPTLVLLAPSGARVFPLCLHPLTRSFLSTYSPLSPSTSICAGVCVCGYGLSVGVGVDMRGSRERTASMVGHFFVAGTELETRWFWRPFSFRGSSDECGGQDGRTLGRWR
ncbi:hypothetical protein BDY21DRAFT_357904, partial [Lineolata rhizophorae]